jgi:catechol 2,3-dioxygenase-like lactoylglutathione lyase family enzyme
MMQSRVGHLVFNVNSSNIPYYKDLLGALGWSVLYEDAGMLGLGDGRGVSLWFSGQVKPVANDYDGPGLNHLALSVEAQSQVDEAVAYLQAHGIPALFETPRHRPEFTGDPTKTYYQVMFASPDRILFEVVYTGPKAN